jgi:hypothetical protein
LKEAIDACLQEKASASEIKAALDRGSVQVNRDAEKKELTGETEALEAQERLGIGDTDSEADLSYQDETKYTNDAKSRMDKVIDELLHEEGLD